MHAARHSSSTALRLSVFAVLLLFCTLAAPQAHAQTTTTLYVFDFDFGTVTGVHLDPTIHVGDTIHWVWQSGFHSTTSVAGIAESWSSGTHSVGTPVFTFDHKFTNAGTFAYYCTVHGSDNGDKTASGMAGKITVLPAAAPEPSAWTGLGLGALGLAGLAGRVRLRRTA